MKRLRLSVRIGAVILCLAAISFSLMSVRLYATTAGWDKGPAPTVDTNIYHTMNFTWPATVTRVNVGIGEVFTAAVTSPFNWKDIDTCGVATSEDSFGTFAWTCNTHLTPLSIVAGASVPFQARWRSTNVSGIVTCTLSDAGNLAKDPDTVLTKTFNIKVPDGITIAKVLNGNALTAVPAGNTMACGTLFYYQVTPITVNFRNVWGRELVNATSITWPNGSTQAFGATTVGAEIIHAVVDGATQGNIIGDALFCGNWSLVGAWGNFMQVTDLCLSQNTPVGAGGHNRTRLSNQAFSFFWKIPLQFSASDDGVWVTFCESKRHYRMFQANGQEAAAAGFGTAAPTVGSYMGPFNP